MSILIRFIHDDGAEARTLERALSTRLRVETSSLAATADRDDLDATPLIVDVDLSDEATVLRLRDRLPRHGGAPRWMAVAAGARAERIQAGVLGASAVMVRPYDPERVAADVDRVVRGDRLETDLGRGRVPDEAPGGEAIRVAEAALADLFRACLAGGAIDAALLHEAGREIARSIAEVGRRAWMDTVRRHHDGTFRHCLLVSGVAVGFAGELGMARADVERLARAALAHDAGKARVPVDLLDKRGRLTEAEFAIVRRHPEWGWALLQTTDRSTDPALLDAVLHHHEALDGSGYPHGLSGGGISDLTRVLTICDVYGALSEPRAYKPPMRSAQIMDVLRDMAANHKLDAALVRALDWIVSGERPPGFAAGPPARRWG